jgi:hypothetical protein
MGLDLTSILSMEMGFSYWSNLDNYSISRLGFKLFLQTFDVRINSFGLRGPMSSAVHY